MKIVVPPVSHVGRARTFIDEGRAGSGGVAREVGNCAPGTGGWIAAAAIRDRSCFGSRVLVKAR